MVFFQNVLMVLYSSSYHLGIPSAYAFTFFSEDFKNYVFFKKSSLFMCVT